MISTGAALLGSAAINYMGAQQANQANANLNWVNRDFNEEQAAITRDFNSAEAQKSRDFAASSHQIEMADLKKAGLNPILSGTSGTVSSAVASGSSASATGQTPMQNELANVLPNAIALYGSIASARKMNAEARNIERLGPVSDVIGDIGKGVKSGYEKLKSGTSDFIEKTKKFDASDYFEKIIIDQMDSFMKNNAKSFEKGSDWWRDDDGLHMNIQKGPSNTGEW